MTTRLKLNRLEQYLQDVEVFNSPKIQLEQYITPPNIAACMFHTIQSSYGDIEYKTVADLGCGTGMLSIASLLLGADYCVGFDYDCSALEVCVENFKNFEMTSYDLITCDISKIDEKYNKLFDTVVMNPPFGTSKKGADVEFLEVGLRLAKNVVYSLHKTSTREHIKRKAKSWHVKCQVVAELRYDLPHSYKFHTKKSVDIKVDLYRFWDLK